jgi:hypothetical protein
MFIAARKLSAARSYFSLFSSASPSVVFYSESLILSFENNDFLALVFLSMEGFGCFFACGLRSGLSTVVGNRRFSLPGFSSSKLVTLTKEIIHAKRPFATLHCVFSDHKTCKPVQITLLSFQRIYLTPSAVHTKSSHYNLSQMVA